MAKFNGTDLALYFDLSTPYTSIATEGLSIELNTSVSLSVNTAEVDCTNKDSSSWKEIIVGNKDWSMSGTAYIDHTANTTNEGVDEAMTAMLAGTLVYATFRDAVRYFTGESYFTNIEQTGEMDGTAEWTFTLSGAGALTTGDIILT